MQSMADSSQSQTQSSDHCVSSSSMITDSSDASEAQTNSLCSSVNSGFIAPSPPLSSHSPSITSIERLEQENRVLKIEIETLKLRIKSLVEENKGLRRASVSIQAKAEQEEEFISNTLLKRIQVLKKEKETLALNYEHEEECLTNDLSRKLNQLRAEKVQLERTLEQEQEALVNKLMRKIEKLENETQQKQNNLEQLRREKIELENTLEQEQEALVNKLWKRMDKLESEKRVLQQKLEDFNKSGDIMSHLSGHSTPAQSPGPQPMSPGSSIGCPSPAPPMQPSGDPIQLSMHIQTLRNEVSKLKSQLLLAENEHKLKMDRFEKEEREQREQNIRLQRKLQIEMERREQLCRHLSESESSLEMDEERQFNEQAFSHTMPSPRPRTLSSPVPPTIPMTTVVVTPLNARPLSPQHQQQCPNCGHSFAIQSSPLFPVKPLPPQSLKKASLRTPANSRCPERSSVLFD